jgi:DNA-binding MarR family transcriptional regulator
MVIPIIQYLQRSLKEEEIYKNNRIQHKESYILRLITLAHLTDKTLHVSDLLSNHDLGSNPTIQSYITKLVLKGFIVRKISDEDKRVQFLIPSDNAISLFDQLSKTLYDEKIVSST